MGRFLCRVGIHNCIKLERGVSGKEMYKCIHCGKITIVDYKGAPKCCK